MRRAPRYATNTTVATDRSLAELRRILQTYNAIQFVFAEEPLRIQFGFILEGRQVRFAIPLPHLDQFEFTPTGKFRRTEKSQREEREKACRQRWRAAVLLIKARLEAIALGVVTFESAFLPEIVLDSDQTVYEWITSENGSRLLTAGAR